MPSLAILISAVLVLSCGQTYRITEADDRYMVAPSDERSQSRGRYGVVCRGNPVWSIPGRLGVKFHLFIYL